MTRTPRQRELLAGCDENQVAAITTEAAPLLILAGAGSGKTRVLARRIAWCVEEGWVSASHVLALTFTRKAAGELRDRLASLGLAAPVTAGTFHAIALAQLRRRAADLGRTAPVILDSKARILGEVLPDRVGLRVAGGRPLERRELLSLVATEIEWAKARLISPEGYAAASAAARREPPVDPELVTDTFTAYEKEKRQRRVLDFDDLLGHLITALEADSEFAAAQRWSFRYLFVDELQDVNTAQLRLLDAWVGGRPELCAVGDPEQSIYGWNGADPSGIAAFAERPGATILELDANYRSTPQVVAIASAALGGARALPATARPDGPVPSVVAYEDGTAEVVGVVTTMKRNRRASRRWGDFAVLARTNAQLRPFEEALAAAGIPTRSSGGRSFFEREVVAEQLASLRRATTLASFTHWLAGAEEEAEELEAPERDDLLALTDLGREYAELDPAPTGSGFVVFCRYAVRNDLDPGGTDAVDLVTFHRAKGLEWPVVFVTGLEEGYVPIAHARSRAALDEERRLLYVALSRAEEELHCSWAKVRQFGSRALEREPSRHLAAIEATRASLDLAERPDLAAAQQAIAESRAILRARRARRRSTDGLDDPVPPAGRRPV